MGLNQVVHTSKTKEVNGKNGLSFDKLWITYLLRYKRIMISGKQ